CASDFHDSIRRWNFRYDASPPDRVETVERHAVKAGSATREESNRNRSRHEHANSHDASSGHDVMPLAPLAELIPVSPRRHFGALRISNSNEFQTFGHSREPDVFRRHAQFRVAKQSLALFDRLPSLFDGSEIPSFARATHYPQSP